uniref:Uncharacterized protein n=1 Tax=Poecilia mexicana TaxID=48701 RepID=A0A3B3Z256_9TELE
KKYSPDFNVCVQGSRFNPDAQLKSSRQLKHTRRECVHAAAFVSVNFEDIVSSSEMPSELDVAHFGSLNRSYSPPTEQIDSPNPSPPGLRKSQKSKRTVNDVTG